MTLGEAKTGRAISAQTVAKVSAMHAVMAAACGQLGERDATDRAVQALLKLRPNFPATVRKDIERWWEPGCIERLIDDWRNPGLEIGGAPYEAVRS